MVGVVAVLLGAAIGAGLASLGGDEGGDDESDSRVLRVQAVGEVRPTAPPGDTFSARSTGGQVSATVEGRCTPPPAGLTGDLRSCEVRFELGGGTVTAAGIVELELGREAVLPVTSGTGDHEGALGRATLMLRPRGDVGREVATTLELAGGR